MKNALTSNLLYMGSQNFFTKSKIVNILDFWGHMVSVTTQLCHSYAKEAIDDMQINEGSYI